MQLNHSPDEQPNQVPHAHLCKERSRVSQKKRCFLGARTLLCMSQRGRGGGGSFNSQGRLRSPFMRVLFLKGWEGRPPRPSWPPPLGALFVEPSQGDTVSCQAPPAPLCCFSTWISRGLVAGQRAPRAAIPAPTLRLRATSAVPAARERPVPLPWKQKPVFKQC